MFRKIVLTLLLIGIISILAPPNAAKAQEIPSFQITNLSEGHSMKIKGDWLYLDGIIAPNQIEKHKNNGQIVQVPLTFSKIKGTNDATGTFSTYIKIPKYYVGKDLAIHIPSEYSAYKVFINNNLKASRGYVATNAKEQKNSVKPSTIYFTPNETTMQITMQISNYGVMRGGFVKSIKINTAMNLNKEINSQLLINSLLIGAVFAIAFFTLIIGYYRSYGKEVLIFGLFCLSVTIREIMNNPMIHAAMIPDWDWEIIVRLNYIFTCFSSFFFYNLIYLIANKALKKWVLYLVGIMLSIINISIVFTDIVTFQKIYLVLYMSTLPISLYGIYALVKTIRLNKKSTSSNSMVIAHIVGIALVFLAVSTEFFGGMGKFKMPSLTFYTLLIYVAIQLLFLSKQFSNEFFNRLKLNEELKELNHCLDEKILVRTAELQNANNLLQKLATVDALTGVYNRHYFNEYMTNEFTNAIEKATPFGILIIDVDDFKKYNDFYGHIEGDELLKAIANHMGEVLPEQSMLARYGGEEFVIVLSNTNREEAVRIAEQVKGNIELQHMIHEGREEGIITVSIGVAVLDESTDYMTVNEFINEADQKLYVGKKTGKNKVVF